MKLALSTCQAVYTETTLDKPRRLIGIGIGRVWSVTLGEGWVMERARASASSGSLGLWSYAIVDCRAKFLVRCQGNKVP